MTSQTINLDLIPKGVPPVVYVSQYDKGQTWLFNILKGGEPFTIPVGASVTIQGTKKDNYGFQYACTYSGNVVTAEETQQMTVLAGDTPAEIRISIDDAAKIIGSLNFIIRVEPAALSDDTIISDTDISMLEQAIELAEKVPEIIQECQQYVDETDANAKIAEKYATGKIEGVDVPQTDPAYHNNAMYYAGEASDSADNAATSESNAADSESNAEAYAVGTRNGAPVASDDPTYENNSKFYAQAAKDSADNAATSESNASDSAQAASDDADAAHDDAILAESYTKGGTGTRAGEDTDNAKYYKEQAAQYAGSAVDFTGATASTDGSHGLVPKPVAGDQTKFLCGDGTFKNVPSGSASLNGLTDVDLNTPANGQVLKYNATTQKWENSNESGGGGSATFAGLTDVNLTNPSDGQLIKYDAQSQKWVNINASSIMPSVFTGATAIADGTSGLVKKPVAGDQDKYLKGDGTWGTPSGGGGANGSIINISTNEITLANKTVTVTCNGETATATIDANGKAQIVGFTAIGTATITATDGNDTATTQLNIPFFGNYDVTLAFWSATLSITTDTVDLYGQTVTIKNSNNVTVGTTTFDNTGAATYLVNKADTYSLSATYAGVTTTTSVVVSAQTTYNVTLHLWTATLNITTSSSDLYGQTITITDSNASQIGTTAFNNSGVATFYVHKSDTFLCECTYGLDTYGSAVVVSAETSYSVVINIGFDYVQWLTAAGISASGYNSISDVFADEEVTRELMLKHASADYLVSAVTDQVDDIDVFCANDTAMKWIGLCDYVCDKLTAINGVEAKFMASQYWERYLKDHVPTMTSNSAPYGEAFGSTIADNGTPYYAPFAGYLDEGNGHVWSSQSGKVSGEYVGYKYTNPTCVKSFELNNRVISYTTTSIKDFKLQASNDGTNYTDLGTYEKNDTDASQRFTVNNDDYYLYYRIYVLTNRGGSNVSTPRIQFYGRSLNVSVPVMTSNTLPYGTASGSTEGSGQPPYLAFDNNDSTGYLSTPASLQSYNIFLEYDFVSKVKLKEVVAKFKDPYASRNNFHFKIQKYNGSEWVDITTPQTISLTVNVLNTQILSISEDANETKYRLLCDELHVNGANTTYVETLQFYGVDYSEKEFEQGTTKKWLYDHGVELKTLTTRTVGTNAVATKNDDNLYFEISSGSSFAGFCTELMDLTNYSLLRAKVGDVCASTAASGTLAIYSTTTPTYNTGEVAYENITPSEANLPNNKSLNISSLNTNYSISVNNSNSGAVTRKQSIKELWLE